jgi:flagellar motor switch protein FliN/FliY
MTSNKDFLSQEEIDALLKQTAELKEPDSDPGPVSEDQPLNVGDYLTPIEQDALGEIGNITFGSAATALSTLLGKKVDITTPHVSVVAKAGLEKEFPKPHVAVHVKYVDGFHGINLLVIQTRDAQIIADLMMGGTGAIEKEELSEIHISAVQEAMNQMMGSAATSMSTIFNRFVNISPPGIDILDFSDGGESKSSLPPEDVFIMVSFRLTIGDLIDSRIMQLLPVAFAKDMVASLMGGGEPAKPEAPVKESAPTPQAAPRAEAPAGSSAASGKVSNERFEQPDQPVPPAQSVHQGDSAMSGHNQGGYGAMHNRNVNVQPVQFASFQPSSPLSNAEEGNLNLLLDIPLTVTVELGRTQKMIKDILELSQGSIIELDKLAGEPVDILINNKFVAKGEVVVIDENFGVRVTDIVNHWDRIQKIR